LASHLEQLLVAVPPDSEIHEVIGRAWIRRDDQRTSSAHGIGRYHRGLRELTSRFGRFYGIWGQPPKRGLTPIRRDVVDLRVRELGRRNGGTSEAKDFRVAHERQRSELRED